MSLEDLEIRKHTQPIQAELDKQKDKNGRLNAKMKRMREALMFLAPSIAVLARDDRHAPSTREEMLKGEELMLASLTETMEEAQALDATYADLEAAVQKYLAEAHALSISKGDEISETLRTLRRDFGPQISVAWAMGSFTGPCAHGRDPYTRCDECGDLEPFEAKMRVRNIGVAKAIETLSKAMAPSLWEKPKGPQGADMYAGMPPAIRHVAGALTNLKTTDQEAVSWYAEERERIATRVRDRVRHELYGRFPNELVDKFIEKLVPDDLLGE